jgi:hypothetical protein
VTRKPRQQTVAPVDEGWTCCDSWKIALYWDSSPILIRGAGGRRVGRISITTPAIGRPDWKLCAVAIKKRHEPIVTAIRRLREVRGRIGKLGLGIHLLDRRADPRQVARMREAP